MKTSDLLAVIAIVVAVVSALIQYFSAPNPQQIRSKLKNFISFVFGYAFPVAVIILYSLYEDFNKEYVLVVCFNFLVLSANIVFAVTKKATDRIYDEVDGRNSYQGNLNVKIYAFVLENGRAITQILFKLDLTKEARDKLIEAQNKISNEILEKLINLPEIKQAQQSAEKN